MNREELKKIIRGLIWLLMGAFFVVYIIYYQSFKELLGIIINIAPSIIFIVGTILIYDHYHDLIKSQRRAGEVEEVIYITYYDAMKNDLLAFITATLILLVPTLFAKKLDLSDIIQAIIAFVAIYYIRVYYFRKIGR